MALNVELDHLQSEVFQAIQPGRIISLAMGRGTGKTYLDRVIIHTQAASRDRIHVGLLMPSLKQARAVFWPQLIDDFTGGLKGRVDFNRTELVARYSNGSMLTTWGAENADSIRGQRFDVVVQDECDDIDADVENAIVRPTFSKSGRNAIWVKSGTPRRGRHGTLFRDFELGRKRHKTAGSEYFSFRFKSCDSPQVDQLWLEGVKADENPLVFAREYDCDFDSGEGLVFPFDEEFHVRECLPDNAYSEFVIGADWGHHDPAVMLRAGILGHGNDAIIHLLSEEYEAGVPNHEWDARAVKLYNKAPSRTTFWPDPSRPDRIADFRRLGINCQETDNDINSGLARVTDFLFRRRGTGTQKDWCKLLVSPKCVNTIKEFGSYRWKKNTDGTFSQKPEDKSNHCLVPGTLVLTDSGEKPIESVTTNDRVLTRSGYRAVVWSGQTFESANTVVIKTSCGTIEGTPDHMIWTENRGWVELCQVAINDRLVSWVNTGHQSDTDSTAKRLDAIHSPMCQTSETTSDLNEADTCTGQSGNIGTDQSQTEITFTTRTKTSSTIQSLTLSAYRSPITCQSTDSMSVPSERQSEKQTLTESDRSLSLGTSPKKAEPGTASTPKLQSLSRSMYHRSALSAELSTKRTVGAVTSSAQTAAKPITEQSQASIISSYHAKYADQCLRSIDTSEKRLVLASVLECSSAGRESPVYDLTVDGAHEFFANGVLVHNSMDSLRYLTLGRFGPGGSGKHVASGR